MKLMCKEIYYCFGGDVRYIEIPHDEPCILYETELTIVYWPCAEKPDEQITLKQYLDAMDKCINE